MSTLSTSATATPAAVASSKETESLRDISSSSKNEESEKSKCTTFQRETSAAATRKNKRNQQPPTIRTTKNNWRPDGVQHCSKRSRSCRAPHNTNRFLINDHKKQQQQQQHPPYSYWPNKTQRHNRSSAANRTFQNTTRGQQQQHYHHLDENSVCHSPYLPHLTPDNSSHNSVLLGDNRGAGGGSSSDGKYANSSSVANSKRFVSPADLDSSQSNVNKNIEAEVYDNDGDDGEEEYFMNCKSPLAEYNTIEEEFMRQVEAIELEETEAKINECRKIEKNENMAHFHQKSSLRCRARLRALQAKLVQFKTDLKLLSFKQIESKFDELINYIKDGND